MKNTRWALDTMVVLVKNGDWGEGGGTLYRVLPSLHVARY